MSHPHPLDILFLTNFSDYCFRAIPAIAQMADAFKVRLTIMHVYDPNRTSKAAAEDRTRSFFPEADRYSACSRVTVAGPILAAVKRHLETWPINLIVAPSSDVIGLPQLGQSSLRAALVRECGVPLWTLGRRVNMEALPKPVRNVACWLDFNEDQTNHVYFAAQYARALGAKLHLLRALPHISEGALVHPDDTEKALHPRLAIQELKQLCDAAEISPELHLGVGEGSRNLNRMLRAAEADVVFFGREESWLADWLGLGLRRADAAPCPAVYISDQMNVPLWNLERGSGLHVVAIRTGRERVDALTPVAARNGNAPGGVLAQLGLA